MYVILTRSGLLFIYKTIREIISMPRADSCYPHNFMVNSWVFKDDVSESEAKTDSRHWVCLLLVGSPPWHGEYMHKVCSWHIVSIHIMYSIQMHAHNPSSVTTLHTHQFWTLLHQSSMLYYVCICYREHPKLYYPGIIRTILFCIRSAHYICMELNLRTTLYKNLVPCIKSSSWILLAFRWRMMGLLYSQL